MSASGPLDGDDSSPDPMAWMAAVLGSLGSAGGGDGVNWEQARFMAAAVATGGEAEPNVDPLARMQLEALARVAELQVRDLTGIDSGTVAIDAATRAQWAMRTIDDYRPMLEQVSESLGRVVTGQLGHLTDEDLDDAVRDLPQIPGLDLSAIVRDLGNLLGPVLTVSLAASIVGQLASRAFGSYDLPLPRPAGREISVILDALDEFGDAWSLPTDDLRLWWCLHEVAHHLVLGLPHVGERLTELLAAHAGAFEADPDAIEAALGDLDLGEPESLEQWSDLMANPDRLLTSLRSPRQEGLVEEIDVVVSTVIGYVDWVVDTVGARYLTDGSRVGEALRRRRVEADAGTRFVERMFGLELTPAKVDLGADFVRAVAARHGVDGTRRLWEPEHLPTRAELEAPGLWMARVGLADDEPLPDLEGDLEIPDFPGFD